MKTDLRSRSFLIRALTVAGVTLLVVSWLIQQNYFSKVRRDYELLQAQNAKLQRDLMQARVEAVQPVAGATKTPRAAGVQATSSEPAALSPPVHAPAPEANGLALAGTETHPIPGGIETTMRFAARKPGPLGLVALAVRLPKNVDARILSLAPFGPAAFADFSKQISEDGRFAVFQGTLGEETNVQFALSVSGPAVANVRGTSGIGAFQLSIQPTKASVTGK